jgi:hypothetical protein
MAVGFGHAEVISIQNKALTVQYDSLLHTFSIAERASGKQVITSGHLLPETSREPGAVMLSERHSTHDRVFGRGEQIRVRNGDGAVSDLELYPNLPFVLIKTRAHNSGRNETNLEHVITADFKLDLGRPSTELRTMGTAGLTSPDKNPGSYLFLTLAVPETRRGVVAGWLTEDRGSGVLFSKLDHEQVGFTARIDYGRLVLAGNETADLETLAVGVFEDARIGQEEYADAVARQYHIRLHPQINGYCTWYSNPHGGAADEHSIVELAQAAADQLKPFGFSFVQIDDKWQDGKERNGPARRFYRVKPDGPYPHGIRPVAEKLQSLGLTTGLWFLPFASDWQDPEFKDKQDWFVKRRDGTLFETAWGNSCLDLTHPEVTNYLAGLVKTIHSWGVNYFKMDGLWTGSATEQIYVNDGFHEDHVDANKRYHAFDFWSGTPLPDFETGFAFAVPGQSCRVISVRAAEAHPVLVSTSRHVTQGIIDVSDEAWSGANKTLKAASRVVANDPYEMRVAGLHDGSKNWKLASASVSASDQRAGVEIEPADQRADEEGWLRLTIRSSTSRTVHWALRFAAE